MVYVVFIWIGVGVGVLLLCVGAVIILVRIRSKSDDVAIDRYHHTLSSFRHMHAEEEWMPKSGDSLHNTTIDEYLKEKGHVSEEPRTINPTRPSIVLIEGSTPKPLHSSTSQNKGHRPKGRNSPIDQDSTDL